MLKLRFRQVENDSRNPFSKVACYIAQVLENLCRLVSGTTVLDSRKVICDLFVPPVSAEGHTLVASDLVDYFANIDLDEVIDTITFYSRQHMARSSNFIVSMVKQILYHKYF